MYGSDVVGDLLDVKVHEWWTDPLAMGTWFQYGPSATADDYNKLHLIFNGEHTCGRFYGFVHAGIISGTRDGQWFSGELVYDVTPDTRCEAPPGNQRVSQPPHSRGSKAFS
jgi:hypothetical protein